MDNAMVPRSFSVLYYYTFDFHEFVGERKHIESLTSEHIRGRKGNSKLKVRTNDTFRKDWLKH